jgi:hypothetical protein
MGSMKPKRCDYRQVQIRLYTPVNAVVLRSCYPYHILEEPSTTRARGYPLSAMMLAPRNQQALVPLRHAFPPVHITIGMLPPAPFGPPLIGFCISTPGIETS